MDVVNNTYNIQEVGLAKALVRKGHQCDVVFWTASEEKVVQIPVTEKRKITVYYRSGKTMLKNTVLHIDDLVKQYDIIQPCEYNQIQAWILSRKYPDKTVIYHGPYYSPFNKRYNLMCSVFDKLLLWSYKVKHTKFIVKSKMAFEFLRDKGIQEQDIAVTGVGIDVQMLNTEEIVCKEPLYNAIKGQNEGLKLLYIGRLEERRNIHFIIDVFNQVLKFNNQARLYIIGNGEKLYMESVWAKAKELGIFEKIVYQEKIEQKYLSGIYKLADVFLLPTEYEIFGMVLLEAMYYGNIVLTTKNGGSTTIMEHDKNGYIVEELNTQTWCKIVETIVKDQSKKFAISTNAHETVKNSYTWDGLAESFISAYKNRLNSQI